MQSVDRMVGRTSRELATTRKAGRAVCRAICGGRIAFVCSRRRRTSCRRSSPRSSPRAPARTRPIKSERHDSNMSLYIRIFRQKRHLPLVPHTQQCTHNTTVADLGGKRPRKHHRRCPTTREVPMVEKTSSSLAGGPVDFAASSSASCPPDFARWW